MVIAQRPDSRVPRREDDRSRTVVAHVDGANCAGARARVQPTHRYAWRGRSLLVTNERLECAEADDLTGYFFAETRHLRTLRLRVNDATPWLCAEGEHRQAELAAVYVYPELTHFEGGGTDMADDWVWRDQSAVTQRSIDIRIRPQVTPRDLSWCSRSPIVRSNT
jgi:hypothetical protein